MKNGARDRSRNYDLDRAASEHDMRLTANRAVRGIKLLHDDLMRLAETCDGGMSAIVLQDVIDSTRETRAVMQRWWRATRY